MVRRARRHAAGRRSSRASARARAPHVGHRRAGRAGRWRAARGVALAGAGNRPHRPQGSCRSRAARAAARRRPWRAPWRPTRLYGSALDQTSLLLCCLAAEEAVAGRHLDNIAPSLLGGIVLVRSLDPIDVVRLPIPVGLRIVLAHPSQRLRTSEARGVLPASLAARGGAASDGAGRRDRGGLPFQRPRAARSARSTTASPSLRALRCCPGFLAAKQSAMTAGALGASISGAGPNGVRARGGRRGGRALVATAMREAYAARRRRMHRPCDPG